MNLPQIINAGVYRYAQKDCQTVESPWIALSLRGLVRVTEYDPSGRLVYNFDIASGPERPRLSVTVPGFVYDFEYNADRENYVIILDWDGLRYDCARRAFVLNYKGVELDIPEYIYLSGAETGFFRQRFEEIMADWNSAIPDNQYARDCRRGHCRKLAPYPCTCDASCRIPAQGTKLKMANAKKSAISHIVYRMHLSAMSIL